MTNILGMVINGNLNLRASPDIQSNILTQIPDKAIVSCFPHEEVVHSTTSTRNSTKWNEVRTQHAPQVQDGRHDSWHQTVYNAHEGFVMSKFIKPLHLTSEEGKVMGGKLNLRLTPSVESPSLAQIPDGAPLALAVYNDEWVITTYNQRTGFVMKRFLAFSSSWQYGQVLSATLNVRKEPDIKGALQRVLVQQQSSNR